MKRRGIEHISGGTAEFAMIGSGPIHAGRFFTLFSAKTGSSCEARRVGLTAPERHSIDHVVHTILIRLDDHVYEGLDDLGDIWCISDASYYQ